MNYTKKRFLKYCPFIDDHGVVRAEGRLQNTALSADMKNPIILPGEHPLVLLLLKHYHKKLLHQGYRVVMVYLINLGIFISSGRLVLKSVARNCLFCRTRRRKLLEQRMGNLPPFRVEPFMSVAVDFFGYLKIKFSRNASVNGSVLIVNCTTTRCIHLELCTSIDINSFLKAWRRFTTSRGIHPKHVFSDRGSTFSGSYSPILTCLKSWDAYVLQQEFPQTMFDFQWDFNTPTASHMNGVVES